MILLSHFHSPVNLLEQLWESFIASRISHEKIPRISHKVPIFPNGFLLGRIDWPRWRINNWLFMVPTDQEPQKS
jgi:hypothetical protein